MARPRIELGPERDAEIAARAARGESAETIFEALGRKVSRATIGRRLAELRAGGAPRAADAPPAPAPASEVPEVIPSDANEVEIDKWIRLVNEAATQAKANGNFGSFASLTAKVATLLQLKHKLRPLPKADPNENPDMRALAAVGRERLRKLAADVLAAQ